MRQLRFFKEKEELIIEELYEKGACPVNPREQSCPMLGCRHHCYVTTERDNNRSTQSIVDRVMSAKYTCMHHLVEENVDGLSIEQMIQQLCLKKQTVRDRLEEAANSSIFDDVINKVEDILDTDEYLTGTQRVLALGELLRS